MQPSANLTGSTFMEQLLDLITLVQGNFSDALATPLEEEPQLTQFIIAELRPLFR